MRVEPIFGNRYRLIWHDNCGNEVGEVRNYTVDGKGYRKIPIFLDDDLLVSLHMRFLVTSWIDRVPEIIASQEFIALPDRFKEAAVWHEVGHIYCEYHLHENFGDEVQLRNARISAVEKGEVVAHEADADRFAVRRIGKEAMIEFLTHLLESRPKGSEWDYFGSRELELRIAAVQELREEAAQSR